MKITFWAQHFVGQAEIIKEKNGAVNSDYIEKSIGAFGLWQLLYLTIVALSRFVAGWNTMGIIFMTPDTKFWCDEFPDNITMDVTNNTCYKTCVRYEYERDLFQETLVSEFDLVCDRAWLASFTQTVMMFGLLLGVSVFGWFSDRYGRSKAMILSGVTNIVFMFAVPFAPSYWSVTACRFFIGLGSGGIFSLTAVYTSEMIGIRLIEVVTCTALMPDAIALASLSVFAYFSSTWRVFTIEYSVVSVILVLMLFSLPETPRWLIANGKSNEAVKLLTGAAKFNNRTTTGIKEHVTNSIKELQLEEDEAPSLTYVDLFRTKKLAIITFASVSIWFVTGFSYFGLSQYVAQLGGNLLLDVVILAILELPATPIAILLTKSIGRKLSAILSFVAIGTSMIILIFIPEGSIAATALGGIGLCASTVVFSVAYLLTIELYPTPMRNMGFSLSSAGSKLGAMAAPFVANLKSRTLATSIFGILPFIAVLVCLIVPETKGKKLKDNVEND